MAATFTDAADQVGGNILVVDPPGGQMENYISRGPLAERKEQTNIYFKNHMNPQVIHLMSSVCIFNAESRKDKEETSVCETFVC